MALFNLSKENLSAITPTTFAALGYQERADLQRLLRDQIDVIVPDGLVISEEFGDWDESNRRIDLLVLDRDAKLVVVELKRTEDGGHADLQALRYAAMISTITFEQVVDTHRAFLLENDIDADPQVRILEFLDWDEPDEDQFAQEVRIVLASAEFSKELTTTALWLNDQGIDVRCVRMKPYVYDNKPIIDVQQVLPLPEAEDYQVRVRNKVQSEKSSRSENTKEKRFREFWTGLLEKANKASDLHKRCSPSKRGFVETASHGIHMMYVLQSGEERVSLTIHRPTVDETNAIFDELFAQKNEIEAEFGDKLEWMRIDGKMTSRVRYVISGKNSFSDDQTWDKLQDEMVGAMYRLEKAVGPRIQKYRDGLK